MATNWNNSLKYITFLLIVLFQLFLFFQVKIMFLFEVLVNYNDPDIYTNSQFSKVSPPASLLL